MIQIKDTLVTLDLIEQFFLCDLDSCKGECCIEGDAGAPISKEEYEKRKAAMRPFNPSLISKYEREETELDIGASDCVNGVCPVR